MTRSRSFSLFSRPPHVCEEESSCTALEAVAASTTDTRDDADRICGHGMDHQNQPWTGRVSDRINGSERSTGALQNVRLQDKRIVYIQDRSSHGTLEIILVNISVNCLFLSLNSRLRRLQLQYISELVSCTRTGVLQLPKCPSAWLPADI